MTKVVILAGGLGTRLAEQTELRPKPMVEIGDMPILWHVMKHYSFFGMNEFCIALGYRGDVIKRYFLDYYNLNADITVRLGQGAVDVRHPKVEDWTVHLVDTGADVNTGGRIRRLAPLLVDATFMITYGDGVCDVDLDRLMAFHRQHGKLATVTAVRPPARFGGLVFDGGSVLEFTEKPQTGEGWINGGYMILEPEVLGYLSGDDASLEKDLLERLAAENELMAYKHDGFWQCIDTLRDLRLVQALWQSGQPPWVVWDKAIDKGLELDGLGGRRES